MLSLFAASGAQAQTLDGRFSPTGDITQGGNQFGAAVARGPGLLVVGAPGETVGKIAEAGAVYIYRERDGSWELEARLAPPALTGPEEFGFSLALSAERLAVGAPGRVRNESQNSGAVYVYERVGERWIEVDRLDGVQTGERFGQAVAMRGERIVVGAPEAATEGPSVGAIYYYDDDGKGGIGFFDRVIGPNDVPFSRFGSAVALDDAEAAPRVFVGAPGSDQFGNNAGAVVVLQYDEKSGLFVRAVFGPSSPQSSSDFAATLAAQRGRVVAGHRRFNDGKDGFRSGAVLVYRLDGTDGREDFWALEQEIRNPDPQDYDLFGSSVALSGDRILVGAPNDAVSFEGGPGREGGAQLYRRSGTVWSPEGPRLTATSGSNGDLFGSAVSIVGRRLAVGAMVGELAGQQEPTGLAQTYSFEPREIIVDTTSDDPDRDLQDGQCLTISDRCSLRAAIMQANASPGPDRILLGPVGGGLSEAFFLFRQGQNEDAAASGDLDILDHLEIIGTLRSPQLLSIDAAENDRVLDIRPFGAGAGTGDLEIVVENVGLRNGLLGRQAIRRDGLGGAVRIADAHVTFRHVTIENSYTLDDGGALYNGDGRVRFVDSSIVGNAAGTNDGLTFVGGAEGGAIFNMGALELERTTVADNIAASSAGAILNGSLDSWLRVSNSTISGNDLFFGGEASGLGITTFGAVEIRGSTIIDSQSTQSLSVIAAFQLPVLVSNSVLGAGPGASVCSGPIVSEGYNVSTDAACPPRAASGDQIVSDLRLGPLTANGGPGETHAPLEGSPVLAAGNPAPPGSPQAEACRAVDQRGAPRTTCDVGAVQLQAPSVFQVDSANDAVDADTRDGICASAAGECTLRAALMQANAKRDFDQILLPAGNYALTLSPGSSTAESGSLAVTDHLAVVPLGSASDTVIDGSGIDDRILATERIGADGSVTDVTLDLSGVTVQGPTLCRGCSGAGLSVEYRTSVTLADAVITGNAINDRGGGIHNLGSLSIDRSVLSNNEACDGGALFNGEIFDDSQEPRPSPRATIRDSTLSGNVDSCGGGAIWNEAELLLERTAIVGSQGGAVFDDGGFVTLRNTTISGNQGGVGTGGGSLGIGTISIHSSTIADNTTFGLRSPGDSFAIDVVNSIIAGNGTADCEFDISSGGSISSGGYNIDSDASCGLDSFADQPGVDPLLAPLAENGGFAPSHALLPGSPALDSGAPALDKGPICLATDQRGLPRLVDADGDGDGGCDIGAVEAQSTCGNDLTEEEELCDDSLGCCSTACGFLDAGTLCDDDDACTELDECNGANLCVSGAPVDPDDGVPCTSDSCDPVDGVANLPNDAFCTDNDVCTGIETCDAVLGCQAGAPLIADDGVPCTSDSCDPVAGVANLPNDAFCTDNDVCTGIETCDAVLGCQAGAPLIADDGVPCTSDSCDPVAGVANLPTDALCDDGMFCNGVESCDAALGCLSGATEVCESVPFDDWAEDVELVERSPGGDTLVLVAASSSGVALVALSPSGSPSILASYDPEVCANEIGSEEISREPAFFADDVEVHDGYAYVSAGLCGLLILDLMTEGAELPLVGSFDTPGWLEDTAVVGTTGYLADHNGGLIVVDLAEDPREPVELATIGFNETEFGAAIDVEVRDSVAFVGTSTGLHLVDVSLPLVSKPEFFFFPTGSPVQDVAIQQSEEEVLVWLAAWTQGVVVVDPTAPADPGEPYAAFGTESAAFEIVIAGDLAFVAEGEVGVSLYSAQQPCPGPPDVPAPCRLDVYASLMGELPGGSYAWDLFIDWDGSDITSGLAYMTYGFQYGTPPDVEFGGGMQAFDVPEMLGPQAAALRRVPEPASEALVWAALLALAFLAARGARPRAARSQHATSVGSSGRVAALRARR